MLVVIVIPILLLLSAFFSGSEIALFSISESRVRALVDERRPGARALQRLKARPERLLATILLLNTVTNVVAAMLAMAVALDRFGTIGAA